MPLAEPLESRLTGFQKLLVLRCLRPDRVLAGVQDFVAVQLGSKFIEPPPFDLAACFKESAPATPLVFVLSPGEYMKQHCRLLLATLGLCLCYGSGCVCCCAYMRVRGHPVAVHQAVPS